MTLGREFTTEPVAADLWSAAWTDAGIAEKQESLVLKEIDDWGRGQPHHAFDAYRRLIRLATPESILDLGCGVGHYARVTELCGVDAPYCGIDVSDPMIAVARKRFNGTFLAGSADHIPFDDGWFDCVLMGGLIGHCADWKAVVKEASRVASRYVLLHRVICNRDPALPEVVSVKPAYGVTMAERFFDWNAVIMSHPWTVVEQVAWPVTDDCTMRSALCKVNTDDASHSGRT